MFSDIHFHKSADIEEAIRQLKMLTLNRDIPIVLADPNIIMKKLLKSLLQRFGFTNIVMNVNGDELLYYAKNTPEEFVAFYNLNYQGYDGVRMYQTLNKISRENPLKFVVISNPLDYRDAETLKNIGVDSLLYKPVDLKGLAECLREIEVL